MPINRLAHYSICTTDLEASRKFYIEVLNLRVDLRLDFQFPGLWLHIGNEDDKECGIIHIIGASPNSPSRLIKYLKDMSPHDLAGTGSLDHITFPATGLADMRARFDRLGLPCRERMVPNLVLNQAVTEDPSGMTIDLNNPAIKAR